MQQQLPPELISTLIANPLEDQPCHIFHPGMTCTHKALDQFTMGVRSVYKMYLMVHLIPFILFKRKKSKENPGKEIAKLLIGFAKSLLFSGGYTFMIKRIVCLCHLKPKLNRYASVLSAIFSSQFLLFEPIGRQAQIALFTLNKTMEVCYLMAKRRSWPVDLPGRSALLMGVATSILMFLYFQCPQAFRSTYLGALNKLFQDC